MNKKELRRMMRKYRPTVDEHWVDGLRLWSILQNAKTVFCFLPLEDEPDTVPLITWLKEQNKCVCVPRCKNDSGEMEAVLLSENKTVLDAFGLFTSDGAVVPPGEIDLALIPGLAFDPKGNRLGRGKGFYDRYLSVDFQGVICGICPSMRFLSALPTERHDRRVDFVFTPYGLYKTNDEKVIK